MSLQHLREAALAIRKHRLYILDGGYGGYGGYPALEGVAKKPHLVGGNDEHGPSIQRSKRHHALMRRHINHMWIEKSGEMQGFFHGKNVAGLFQHIDSFVRGSIGPGTLAAHPAGLPAQGAGAH